MGKVKIARRKVRTALRSVRAVCSLPTGRKQGCPRSALHGSSEAILPGGPGGVGVGIVCLEGATLEHASSGARGCGEEEISSALKFLSGGLIK